MEGGRRLRRLACVPSRVLQNLRSGLPRREDLMPVRIVGGSLHSRFFLAECGADGECAGCRHPPRKQGNFLHREEWNPQSRAPRRSGSAILAGALRQVARTICEVIRRSADLRRLQTSSVGELSDENTQRSELGVPARAALLAEFLAG